MDVTATRGAAGLRRAVPDGGPRGIRGAPGTVQSDLVARPGRANGELALRGR
ncbi:hypothetical protein [Streptomyces sp. KMM 9044]|uniref:hypothetical protein n=1 Tax=Streptomyces sp. KMM 9044 TaxID=2744474 RepID=UPI002151BA79|nr:hypothetical protein [Streptomyces sp. KMM 9044]WAX77676.1 hypothetical protein HUV60_008305 [Streptomyces sp. KMM 9044]